MIDICYYSSDFYAPYTGISMQSLCENNVNLDFRLHCIDTGISRENQEKMFQTARQFGKELEFHDYEVLETYIRDELKLPICNGSYATYIKIFPDKIFHNVDRILFMDGDTIIHGSIKDLVETDLDPYVFAAVKVPLINEGWVYKENRPDNIRLEYALKFKDIGYYNIGVFYCNLKRWAEEDFGNKILSTRDKHLPRMSLANDVPIDEMMMNLAVLENPEKHYAVALPTIFNATTHNIPHYRAKKAALMCGYIDPKEFDKAYYYPIIIHYCIFKPWFSDGYTRYKRLVRKYKKHSLWPDAFEERLYIKPIQKFFGWFVYSLPLECLMLLAIRFGHFVLRTRARIKAKFASMKCRLQGKNFFYRAFKEKRHREKHERAKEQIERSTRKQSHLEEAIQRRWQCLKACDFAGAFAWPKEWLSQCQQKDSRNVDDTVK